jgi:nitroreductase
MTTGLSDAAVDRRAEIDQLAEATLAALRAPSILNTQPWRWRLTTSGAAELHTDRGRQLPGLDPEGRMMLLSCGSALHHALTALNAGGYAGAVTLVTDDSRPDLVAELRRGKRITPDYRNYRAIYQRRTDRRPFSDTPPTRPDIDALRAAAERHGVHLHLLTKDQLPAFAVAVHRAGVLEEPFVADVVTWTARPRPDHDGVSLRTVTPAGRRTVAPRDFAQHRTPGLPLGAGDDRGTAYAVLFTDGDDPRDWLAAGRALSDVWLTLTGRGLAASPISEVVETPATRQVLRQLLGGIGYPAIALRFGVPVPAADAPPPSRRRPGIDVIDLP